MNDKIELPNLEDIFEDEEELGVDPNQDFIENQNKLFELSDLAIMFGPPPEFDYEIINDFKHSGWINDFNLDMVLSQAIELGASDVHIDAGQQVAFTLVGDISYREEFAIPDMDLCEELVKSILTNEAMAEYNETWDFDYSYEIRHGKYTNRRFRLNLAQSFSAHSFCFRVISDTIPPMEKLAIEDEIVEWTKLPSGLILICGTTGSGKSTTIASVIRNVQLTNSKKIVTIEKPIEYVYPKENNGSFIVQREVGIDCRSFYSALTGAMRQNPDIIILGEVRNTEEVSELIRSAETGHLSISTMHTNSVSTTVNRILSLFSGDDKLRIMATLADTMKGMGNQILVRDGKGGRFAVRELLTVNNDVKVLIGNGDITGIRDYQLERQMTMEDNLIKAVKEGRCTYEEALRHTSYLEDFNRIAKRELGV